MEFIMKIDDTKFHRKLNKINHKQKPDSIKNYSIY